MSDDHSNLPQPPDDALGRELRDRTPEPADGYWAVIDARLAAAEADGSRHLAVVTGGAVASGDPALDGDGSASTDTAAGASRLKGMQTTPRSPSLGQRLLGAAAVVLLVLVGIVAVVSSNDDGPVDGVTSNVDDTTDVSVAPASTTSAPSTTVEPAPSTTATTESLYVAMPDVVGAASLEEANAAISAACGITSVGFPSPAWDPANPVPDGQVMATWPSAGGLMLRTDRGCTTSDGFTITIFYAAESYCSGPDDPVGLGYCPVQGAVPEEPTPPPTTVPPTTIQPYTVTMPNVVGLASLEAAVAAIEAVCGGTAAVFPSPAWDPANPQPAGTILASSPAAGGTIHVGDDGGCRASETGMTITLFAADKDYCSGPDDPVGLGWCPRNTAG